jgi:hypothetical protein
LHRNGLDFAPVRCRLVILMIVKEASYPLLECCLPQLPDAAGALEELSLQLHGNSIPAHKHGRAQALQDLLFFLGKGRTVVVILSPLNHLIDMDCHPFFVFSKRRVGLLEIEEFPRFVRRTRYVGQERPEFGCFGSEMMNAGTAGLFGAEESELRLNTFSKLSR